MMTIARMIVSSRSIGAVVDTSGRWNCGSCSATTYNAVVAHWLACAIDNHATPLGLAKLLSANVKAYGEIIWG